MNEVLWIDFIFLPWICLDYLGFTLLDKLGLKLDQAEIHPQIEALLGFAALKWVRLEK